MFKTPKAKRPRRCSDGAMERERVKEKEREEAKAHREAKTAVGTQS
jgi:hypothetical protein